jgi:hypothetical protein
MPYLLPALKVTLPVIARVPIEPPGCSVSPPSIVAPPESAVAGQNAEHVEWTYDLGELGRYYRCYERLMAHWHRVLPPGRILDVRYEDVVADLEGQARRIVAHCGLAWDDRCLLFHETDRPVRTASQVRQPIYKTAVGRWREVEEFLAPLLAELDVAASVRK